MKTLYDRAAIIPGRCLTRSKKPFRKWTVGGCGSELYDADGKVYIDMLCALGAVSLGHKDARPRCGGGVFSLPHVMEIEAAEAVLQHVAPWASSVRFTKTGSEATHAAYCIAKAATGRFKVLMGQWAYHGWHEWCSWAGGRFVCVHNEPITEAAGWDDQIAAVFIEPHRWEPVDVAWLRAIRDFCNRVGALLVFDSMIYGGRWALGGTSEYFDVIPDLECYGKAFGNGQSVAFVVGNDALREHGEIVSGTYSGDVVGLSAVVETLNVYTTEPVIDTLWTRGRQLQEGLRSVIPGALGVCEGEPVHQRVHFYDPTHKQRFSDAMGERGVLWHPDVANIMYAHTAEQIERVIEAAKASVKTL